MTKRDYGMYTAEGNRAVDVVVRTAQAIGSDWGRVQVYLSELAELQGGRFSEAMDTTVREAVYVALGFDSEKS